MAFGITAKTADRRTTAYPHPPRPAPRPRIRHTLDLVSNRKAMDLLEATYKGQRALRAHHLSFLRHLIRSGHWRQGAEIHFARIEDEVFLINGQHTLTAIVAERTPVWLTLVHHEVTTMAEVARLYETFDRNLRRSLEDVFATDPEIAAQGWSKHYLRAVSGASALLASGWHYEWRSGPMLTMLRDPYVRGDLLRAWAAEANNALSGMHGPAKLKAALIRAGVLSVLLCTYRWQPDKAHLFWPAVCRDSGLMEGQPERALVHWLLTTPARAMHGEVYARYVATAWNASYEGRELAQVVARDQQRPLAIAGTPHTALQVLQYLSPEGTPIHEPIRAGQGSEYQEE